MKCLVFDVGEKWGWAFINDGVIESSGSGVFKKLLDFEKEIKEIITLWKPDAVGTAKPNKFYNTVKAHFRYITVIELVWVKYCADKLPDRNTKDFKIMLLNDQDIKKNQMGTTKVSKKEVLEKYGGETEDEADARMMGLYLNSVLIS